MFKMKTLLILFIFLFSITSAEHLEGTCLRSDEGWIKSSDIISKSASYISDNHHDVQENNVCENVDKYYSITFDLNPNELITSFSGTIGVSWDTVGDEWIATITGTSDISSRGPFFWGIASYLNNGDKYQLDWDMKASREVTLNYIGYEQNNYAYKTYTLNTQYQHVTQQVLQNNSLPHQAIIFYNSGTVLDSSHEWQVGDKLYVKNLVLSKEVKAGEKVGTLWKPSIDSFKGWYDQYGNLVTEDTVITENLQISYRTINTENDSYQILDYIGSSGTQWAMTDLVPTKDMWFDLTFAQRGQATSSNGYNFVLGVWAPLSIGTRNDYFIVASGDQERNYGAIDDVNLGLITEIRPTVGTKYRVINGQGFATINGVQVLNNIKPNDITRDHNILLLANNGPCSVENPGYLQNNCEYYPQYGKSSPYKWGATYSNDNLYYAKVYTGTPNNEAQSVLVGNFIPARRTSNGELGFFDSISKKFYTNLGKGKFIASPSLKTSEYKNNTLYINGVQVPQLKGLNLASDGTTITDPTDGFTWSVSYDLNVYDNGVLNYSYPGPVTFELCIDDVCSGEYTDCGIGSDLFSNHKVEYRPKYVPAGYTVEYDTYYLYDDLLPNMGFGSKGNGDHRFVIGINPSVTH